MFPTISAICATLTGLGGNELRAEARRHAGEVAARRRERIDVGIEAFEDQLHGSQQADGAAAEHDSSQARAARRSDRSGSTVTAVALASSGPCPSRRW